MRVAHLRPFASRLRPVFVLLAALLSPSHLLAQEPIVGLPCEGCEAVFQGLPSALASTARIAPSGEPGTPMTITDRVLGPDTRPRAGVVVDACQTNARGVYPPPSRAIGAAADRHGALRAWAVTGADGRYTFETIRPGSYPSRDTPEHVHMHVIERGCATYPGTADRQSPPRGARARSDGVTYPEMLWPSGFKLVTFFTSSDSSVIAGEAAAADPPQSPVPSIAFHRKGNDSLMA